MRKKYCWWAIEIHAAAFTTTSILDSEIVRDVFLLPYIVLIIQELLKAIAEGEKKTLDSKGK
ncbi:MAG TPA: hypothetical protein VGQ59_08145 [Cyclobacteriaceae bacterium]|jgi:hypothetical protein|nr:hypothetical protein [Cyclobacteriaceae bacterium]